MAQIKVCRFKYSLTLTLESGKKSFSNCIVIKIDFTRSHMQLNNETTCKGILSEKTDVKYVLDIICAFTLIGSNSSIVKFLEIYIPY